jgi:hypothetical protein
MAVRVYLASMRKPTAGIVSRFVFALAAACLPVACNSAQRPDRSTDSAAETDPVGRVPADLWLEIDVSPGRGVEDRAKVEERAARFVLLPDGALHGESDRVPHDGLRPARVRRLSREQMVDVWTALASAGFTDAAFADTRGNVKLMEPGVGEVLATLELHADGDRFCFVRRYKPGGDEEQAMRRVIRSIASLAWSSDEALAETAELPLRYDLGSDPYARFVKPSSTPSPANAAAGDKVK